MPKSKLSQPKTKLTIAVVAFLILLLGLGAAYALSQSRQDIAPKASEFKSANSRCNLPCNVDAECPQPSAQSFDMVCLKTGDIRKKGVCRLKSKPSDRYCGQRTGSPSPSPAST